MQGTGDMYLLQLEALPLEWKRGNKRQTKNRKAPSLSVFVNIHNDFITEIQFGHCFAYMNLAAEITTTGVFTALK